MDKEKHVRRHKLLHRHYDELLADFILHNEGKLPSKVSLVELLEWSAGQITDPSEFNTKHHGDN
jgi:hypothetical protein